MLIVLRSFAFWFLVALLLVAPWFDGYATLIMSGPAETVHLEHHGTLFNPRILSWSAPRLNSGGETFECYGNHSLIASSRAVYRIGTARKWFSTLTLYEILDRGDGQPGGFTRGPVALVSLNYLNALIANFCVMAMVLICLFSRRTRPDTARVESHPQERPKEKRFP